MRRKQIDNLVRQFTTYLPCRLTDEELTERGQELAHARKASEDFSAEAATKRKELKERETELDGEVSRLARVVRDRSEQRPVLVEVRMTKKAGMVDEIRTDTGEVIHNRKMADNEAQTEMLEFAGADEENEARN